MLKRTITAIVALGVLFIVCWFSATPVFPIAFGFCALLGVYEMLGCIGVRKNFPISVSMYAMAIIAAVLTRTVSTHSIFVTAYSGLLFCILLVLFAVAVFSNGEVPIDKVCIAFTTCAYVITGFITIVLIRDMKNGVYIYLLAFIGPWVTDTFAYFCGKLFGKHKLIPKVSPKKTIEGSVGGIIFCIIACTIYGYFIGVIFSTDEAPTLWIFAVLGLVISIVSQIGDLILSLIKRRYGIKDYGIIFPGHGGVLDRFDSIIATAPLILIFCESMIKLSVI